MHTKPGDIERTSLSIIRRELEARGIVLPEETAAVVKRVIHATADLDYAENLRFTDGAVARGVEALRRGRTLVTDTNMALAGVSKPALSKLGGKALCLMAEPAVAAEARERETTRAAVSMERAAKLPGRVILAIGNAPTALIRACEMVEAGEFAPELIIGAPVGFVNVVESKERIIEAAAAPYIVSRGRKGGSNVAAAICNAMLYQIRR